jgi:hypothetical protein
MQTHQSIHVLATYREVLQILDDMRGVLRTGLAADGTRFEVGRLPQRERLLAAFEEAAASFTQLVRELVPGWEQEAAVTKSAGAAVMWMQALLLVSLDHLADLQPERMSRQYGALDAREAEVLGERVNRVAAALGVALDLLRAIPQG